MLFRLLLTLHLVPVVIYYYWDSLTGEMCESYHLFLLISVLFMSSCRRYI